MTGSHEVRGSIPLGSTNLQRSDFYKRMGLLNKVAVRGLSFPFLAQSAASDA